MAILKNGEVIRLDDLAVLPESFSKVLTSDKVMYVSPYPFTPDVSIIYK